MAMNGYGVVGQPDTSDPDFQVLLHAVSSCAGPAVIQLLKQNPTLVKKKGWHGHSALHRACLSGDVNMVQLLCENGADPNICNDFKETPVHYAAKRGIPTLVNVLKKFGGNLDAKDAAGKTPIHNAAETGSVYMLKYFEEQGLGFRDLDDKGLSPLHCVCTFGHLDAFRFLIRKGRSDLSHKNKEGDTALHVCVRQGYSYGSWLLINYMGTPCLSVTNAQGLSPVDVGRQYERSSKLGHQMIVPVLNELSKLPPNAKITGPAKSWYWNLTMPFFTYCFALLLAYTVFTEYQGIVFMAAIGLIIRNVMQSSHRLPHVSRWANPLYCGTFCAGIAHTMFVYYVKIANPQDQPLLVLTCVVFNIIQIYLFYKLLRSDPGLVKASVVNSKTGQPSTLKELCDACLPLDTFCGDCEIIRTKVTKHCKICDQCYYRMDHHCLFLLKCIGYNNHARFVWFIIVTAAVMCIFVLQCALWTWDKYPQARNKTYSELLLNMFWTDGWILSMVFLNIGSIVWAASLIQYQLKVVSRGQTTYFQRDFTTLTTIDKFINTLNFLQGKSVYASDYECLVDQKKVNDGIPMQRDVHNV